jgi:hypothetical protein
LKENFVFLFLVILFFRKKKKEKKRKTRILNENHPKGPFQNSMQTNNLTIVTANVPQLNTNEHAILTVGPGLSGAKNLSLARKDCVSF